MSTLRTGNRRFTEEESKYLKVIIPGRTTHVAAAEFNEKFPDLPIDYKQVQYFKRNNKIRSGVVTQWGKNKEHDKKRNILQKGQSVPGSEATRFKKGNKPLNTLPLGSEVLRSDGYIYRKIAETKPARKGWKQVHYIIWEEANGPLKEGEILTFINQDRTDIRLENLKLITQAVNVRLNQSGLNTGDAEILEVGISMAKLQNKIGKIKAIKGGS